MAIDPRIFSKEAGCQKERDSLIKIQNEKAHAELVALNQARAKDGVLSGINEILKISYQPEAYIANYVAKGKDAITDTILGHMGGSRVMDTILSQAAPAARQAVNNASQSILETLTNGILDIDNLDEHLPFFTDAAATIQNITDALGLSNSSLGADALRCGPLPYAMDLANIGVKQPFLFVVEFVFSQQYQASIGKLAFPFMVKSCGRPSVQFEYEEINMYNYRTKIVKRANYQPLTMTFYDDATSQVTSFYQQYVKAMSPIANVDTPHLFETEGTFTGMDFTKGNAAASAVQGTTGGATTLGSKYGASIGVLSNDHINGRHILQKINIYHLYRSNGQVFEDTYTLMNPRIVDAQLSELNMTESNATETTFTLEYDSFYGQTQQNPNSGHDPISTKTVQDLTSIAGQFPLKVTTPGDYGKKDAPAPGPASKEAGFFENLAALPGKLIKDVTTPFLKDTAIGRIVTGTAAGGGVSLDKIKAMGKSIIRLDGS